ncbi:MAG: hypothetical protein ACE15F_11870, partial [bacterium]
SAYPLEKKAFHLLDEIRADTKVRSYTNSLTLALSQREKGLMTPANPIEQQPHMLEKKSTHLSEEPLFLSFPGLAPWAILMPRPGRLKSLLKTGK